MNKIIFPIGYFPDPTKFGTLGAGVLYIGDPGEDPTVEENRKQVWDLQEDNTTTAIDQPITLSAGGIPLSADGLRYPTLFVDGDYSMAVLDEEGGIQIYYIPSAKVILETDSITTAELTNDDLDVSGVGVIYCNTTSHNVTIGSFVGGVGGQTIHIIKYVSANDLTIENNEGGGTQKIFLDKGADKTFSTLGGVMVTYKDGVGWFESTAVASEAIVAGDIADDAVTEDKILDDAVTTSKIKNLAITAAKIATNTITAAQIAVDAIKTIEITDGVVTYPKLSASATETLNVEQRISKAWCNYDGVADSVRDSFNVFGVTKLSTGSYLFIIDVDMADTNYVVVTGGGQSFETANENNNSMKVVNPRVVGFDIITIRNSDTVVDFESVFWTCFGNIV